MRLLGKEGSATDLIRNCTRIIYNTLRCWFFISNTFLLNLISLISSTDSNNVDQLLILLVRGHISRRYRADPVPDNLMSLT